MIFNSTMQSIEAGMTWQLTKQFNYAADPSKNHRHNASIILATTTIWYNFSYPLDLTFHHFNKTTIPPKNVQLLLRLGLKFIPTPSLTNSWTQVMKHHIKTLQSVYLHFHFTGATPKEGTETYDPKIYVQSTRTPPQSTILPVALEE